MNWSDAPLRVFLARHGQSLLNLQERISGQAETPLSDKGQEQARALCDVLRGEALTAIYASSLGRTLQTAQPTASHHGLEPAALDGLREIGLGVLEGRHVDERDAEAAQLWSERRHDERAFQVPGGEAYADFEARVSASLDWILANSRGSILIVGHRNTNAIILSRLLGQREGAQGLNVKNKYLYAVDFGPDPAVSTIRLGGEFHGTVYQGLRT